MSTGDRNTLGLFGKQAKVTTLDALPQVRLLAYLRGLPTLAFSDKGRAHICQRFGVSADELAAAVAVLAAHPRQSTSKLLRVISAAVERNQNAKGGGSER